jgi:uncharacterized protein (DUF2235 family)
MVRTFRHAVALDERRAKFKANLWNRPTAKEQTLGIQGQKPEVPQVYAPHRTGFFDMKHRAHKQNSDSAMEDKFNTASDRPTDIEEVSHVPLGR